MWRPVLVALQGISPQDNASRLDHHNHDVEKLGHNDNLSTPDNNYNNIIRQLDDDHTLRQFDDNDHGWQCCECQRN